MTRIQFIFGLGQNKDGLPIQNEGYKLSAIKREAARLFGGYTYVETAGGWHSPSGMLIEEPGGLLDIVSLRDAESLHKVAVPFRAFIKEVLEQEAIVVTIQKLEVLEIE
jgi:hypothetical protein